MLFTSHTANMLMSFFGNQAVYIVKLVQFMVNKCSTGVQIPNGIKTGSVVFAQLTTGCLHFTMGLPSVLQIAPFNGTTWTPI